MLRLHRSLCAFVAVGLAATACSDSSSTPSAADFGAGDFSIRGGLDALIVPPAFVGDERLRVSVTDFAGAAATLGVGVPPPAAGFQVSEPWIRALFSRSIADGGTGLQFVLPRVTGGGGFLDEPETLIDEFGWSPLAISAFAEATQFPDYVVVMTGDLSWSDTAIDVGDGVRSIGEGDDFARSLKDRTDLRLLGEPIRVGERDGMIAAAPSTAAMAAWIAGDAPSLRADDRYAAAAAALDDADAVHADLLGDSFAIGDIDAEIIELDGIDIDVDAVTINERFDVVGIGVTIADGHLVQTIVYVFADDDAAQRAVTEVDEAWSRARFDDRDVRSLIDVGPAERRGRTVVVSGPLADVVGSRIGLILASNLTTVFLHR